MNITINIIYYINNRYWKLDEIFALLEIYLNDIKLKIIIFIHKYKFILFHHINNTFI